MTFIKMAAIVLSLGMDTLMVSLSLGMAQVKGKLKIALTFTLAEAIMPLVGLFAGKVAGTLTGNFASLFGGVALVIVGLWQIFFEREQNETMARNLAGFALLLTALSVSLDELVVGFSIGLVGVPVALTVVLISLQAFVLSFAGLTLASRLTSLFGEWAEKVGGSALALLGLWILIEAVRHLVLI